MVTREDVWEIKALLSKILEKCDEVHEKFRASLDYLESSVEETGFEDPGINNENQEYNLQLGSEEATNAEPNDSARNRECSERLVITQPSASKTINFEEPEFANGETKDELQLGFEKATQVEPVDSVDDGEYSWAQFSGKLQIHLKFLTVGRVIHNFGVDFWVHNGSPKMASNARATGLIAVFMKDDVLSSTFWVLVDTIWDPGGNYLNFAPNATSKVATPTMNVLGKMNEASNFSEILLKIEIFLFGSGSSFRFLSILLIQNCRQKIRVLFLVEDWQFQFGLLLSSPFFLKSFYISAYKVFGESTDPYLAIQIGILVMVLVFVHVHITSKLKLFLKLVSTVC